MIYCCTGSTATGLYRGRSDGRYIIPKVTIIYDRDGISTDVTQDELDYIFDMLPESWLLNLTQSIHNPIPYGTDRVCKISLR